MRESSIQAYGIIVASGLVGESQQAVWRFLAGHPDGLTGRELESYMSTDGSTEVNAHKRLPELRDMGIVREMPPRRCSITSMIVSVWVALDAKPHEPPPKVVRAPRSKKEIERLKDEWKVERDELIEQNETLIMMNEKLRDQVADLTDKLATVDAGL